MNAYYTNRFIDLPSPKINQIKERREKCINTMYNLDPVPLISHFFSSKIKVAARWVTHLDRWTLLTYWFYVNRRGGIHTTNFTHNKSREIMAFIYKINLHLQVCNFFIIQSIQIHLIWIISIIFPTFLLDWCR